MTDLFKPEKAILDHIENDFKNKAILDIGIGTGRTTRHLLNISKNYIGIDYSHTMVCVARHAFPGVRLLHMDARDLSEFANGQFDLIWHAWERWPRSNFK
jgi:ubiquinone/menaquinone biosynthesis C-methylase UbiE